MFTPPRFFLIGNKRRSLTIMLVLTLSMLVLAAPVSSQTDQTQSITIRSMAISLTLDDNGTTMIRIDAEVTNVGPSPLTEVGLRIDSLELNLKEAGVEDEPADARLEVMERHSMLMISLPDSMDVNETLRISGYLSSSDLQSNPETDTSEAVLYRSLIFYMRPHDPVYNLTLTTTLPPRGTLSSKSVVPLFPEPVQNMTDGQSITFAWNTPYLQPGQEKVFIVKYSTPLRSTGDTVTISLSLSLALIGGIIIGILGVTVAPHFMEYISRFRRVRYLGVTDEEQLVLDLLQQKGGSCRQKELYLESGLLESKLSLLLGSMERRGLVRRFRKGREKLVYLVEE